MLAARGEPIKWIRFKGMHFDSSWWINGGSDRYKESIVFKPKSSIFCLGFGWFNHYYKKNFKLVFTLTLDNETTEVLKGEIECNQEDLKEDKMFEINFEKLGLEGVSVAPDQKLYIFVNVPEVIDSHDYAFNYGYDG